jgi:hypothetical protein
MATQGWLQTEQPVGSHVEKNLFQKQSRYQINPAEWTQNDRKYSDVYHKPTADEEDEAKGPKLLAILLYDSHKESKVNQTKKDPDGANVVNFRYYKCSDGQRAD